MNYDWRGLDDDVRNYVSTCDVCQRNKIQRTPFVHPAIITDTPLQLNDKIAMDIFGPLPTTRKGNRFILSIQDQLTKYLVLVPLTATRAEDVVTALLENYVYTFSIPKSILTDQGANFIGQVMQEFEENFGIRHIQTTSWHPQSNGFLERAHAVVQDLLKTATAEATEKEWDE